MLRSVSFVRCSYLVYCNHYNPLRELVVCLPHQQIQDYPFIFTVLFFFLVVVKKCKNQYMGNCISKINKDLIFVYEKQRITFLSKGVLRRVRCMGTKETYTGAYSLMRFSEIITLNPLKTGIWCKDL